MANKKIKFPLWLMPDTKATVECLYRQDGCNSQSEFIEKAILFYCGYLQSEYAGDFLPKILGETLEAILSMFGDRIGKLLLKQAVEQNVCNHILASDTDIDAQTYQQMRGKSYQEVLRTNGQISFPEVQKTKPQMDWRAIKNMRNMFAHDYGSMDKDRIWQTATEDVPALKAYCERALTEDF